MRRALPLLVVILFAGCVPSSASPEIAPTAVVAQPGFRAQLEDVLHVRVAGWLTGFAGWDTQVAVRRPAASSAHPPGRRTAFSVNWDAVAQCESGGDWAADTGNGFTGGLQFTASTWVGYGGREFAEHAYQATREQQIAVAERVLAGQGIGAWPVCGRRA